MEYQHTPVMAKEVLHYLDPKPNENFIDATLGLGGHARKILDKTAPNGKLLGIEQNKEGLDEACKNLQKYKNRIVAVCDNFLNLDKIIRSKHFSRVSGIIFDLGVASWQIEDSGIGIAFSKNFSLDMRLGDYYSTTAADILNNYTPKELANLFYELGDFRHSHQIAKKIVEKRREKKIRTSFDFIEAIGIKNPKVLAPIFQALRIEVNHELENLNSALPQALNILAPNGRIVAISYHSGEDRIVKNFMRSNKGDLKILTKKPIIPDFEEIKLNSRARSAKLRAGEKV